MKTYTPKPWELEEMWFTHYPNEWVHTIDIGTLVLECDLPFWTIFDWEATSEIFPQSKSDIETIIRLFSKP